MAPKETAWTTYWQANRLDSCIVRANREEEDKAAIFAFWLAFVEVMPEGGSVLDLATGNGAVALRLVEAAQQLGRGLTVNAVDLADIDPEKFLRDHSATAKKIAFMGNTDICALPFPNHSFDGIVSQFGFEYASRECAVAELARVLKPDGKFQLLVHHEGGALVAPNVAQVEEMGILLCGGGLVQLIDQVLSGTSTVDALEQEGRRLVDAHGGQLPRITAEIFDAVHQLLTRHDLDLGVRRQGVAGMRRRLEAERDRMQQLAAAALSESDAASLADLMTSVGLKNVVHVPVHVSTDQALLGWKFAGRG